MYSKYHNVYIDRFPSDIAKHLVPAHLFAHIECNDLQRSLAVTITGLAACNILFHHLYGNQIIDVLCIKGQRSSQVGKPITAQAWALLAPCLVWPQHISLQGHNLGMEELSCIMMYVTKNQRLQKLDLWDNQMDGQSAMFVIRQVLDHNLFTISSINLGENNIDAEDKLEIRQIVQEFSSNSDAQQQPLSIDYW